MLHNFSFIIKILSGMAKAVGQPAAAVASTTHPGSVNNSRNQLLMTLSWGHTCVNNNINNEDVAIESIELYVQ